MSGNDNEIARSLGRLEGKVDLLIDLHKTTQKRVGAVEKRSYWASGAVAVALLILNKANITSFFH